MVRIAFGKRGFEDAQIEREVFDDRAEIVVTDETNPEEYVEEIGDASAVLNPPYPTSSRMFNSFESLEVVAIYGIGTDHVNLEAATANDVQVVNVPDYCIEEVSTHAIALLLAAVRRLPEYDRQTREGKWNWNSEDEIFRLRERTFGLFGFGDIARRVAEKVAAFGVDVIAYDPFVETSVADEYGVTLVSFDQLLDEATLLSLHAPLTPKTEGIIDRSAFKRLDPETILVNTARGALIDENALLEALKTGEIERAALDVLSEEPPDEDDELRNRKDVLLTPHVGWYSVEAEREVRYRASRDARRVLEGEQPEHPINEPH